MVAKLDCETLCSKAMPLLGATAASATDNMKGLAATTLSSAVRAIAAPMPIADFIPLPLFAGPERE